MTVDTLSNIVEPSLNSVNSYHWGPSDGFLEEVLFTAWPNNDEISACWREKASILSIGLIISPCGE